MALHISLTRNSLPQGLPRRPRVINREPLTFDVLLDRMSMDTALNATDMRGTFDRFGTEGAKALADGQRVETPLGSFSASVLGKRNGDPVAPEISAANAVIRFRPSEKFLTAVRSHMNLHVEEDLEPRKPLISVIYNFVTKAVSNEMSAKQMVELRGSRMSFSEEDPAQGVFFVAGDGGETASTLYTRSGCSRIDLQVPALAKGQYTLVVRSRREEGAVMREGIYPEPVSIV